MVTRTHRVTQHRSGIPGIEAMTLVSDHVFPRHSHDHFGIGVMTSGAQRSWSLVGHVESEAGDVIMCNPGEMHDGMPLRPGTGSREPGAGARGWRILYFDPRLISVEISQESTGELIVPPVVRDRRLSRLVSRLFAHVERDRPDTLVIEQDLMRCLMIVSQRHRLDGAAASHASPSVRIAIRRLDEAPEIPISLADLAMLSGVSRFQLLRGFAREVGTTPHAYVIQRRARLVRKHLASGKSPSDAALLSGFADQSHMTRAFVRHFGIPPARYQAALA
ncbi:MAG TPA: AraC family transcriptional regulator [Vicinamibacterales bacterium]|nr:AraC family transcriptional regulator [Vicinamibacterales bacterium]